jgi:hypothetical protein
MLNVSLLNLRSAGNTAISRAQVTKEKELALASYHSTPSLPSRLMIQEKDSPEQQWRLIGRAALEIGGKVTVIELSSG